MHFCFYFFTYSIKYKGQFDRFRFVNKVKASIQRDVIFSNNGEIFELAKLSGDVVVIYT